MSEVQDKYEETPNLYRPGQIEEGHSDIESLTGVIDNAADYKVGKRTRARAQRQLANIRINLERYTPRPFAGAELDKAVDEADRLRDEMVSDGMPTGAEMRRCPPGTVDKHRAWEARNKTKWLRWKYLQLRLNAGSGARDAANFEKHRPTGGAAEADLSVSLVPSKDIHFGPAFGQGQPTVMSAAELQLLKMLDPKLSGQIAMLDTEQREQVRDVVRGLLDGSANVPQAAPPDSSKLPPKAKRKSNWTPEMKKAFGEKMKAARAKKAAERAEKEPT